MFTPLVNLHPPLHLIIPTFMGIQCLMIYASFCTVVRFLPRQSHLFYIILHSVQLSSLSFPLFFLPCTSIPIVLHPSYCYTCSYNFNLLPWYFFEIAPLPCPPDSFISYPVELCNSTHVLSCAFFKGHVSAPNACVGITAQVNGVTVLLPVSCFLIVAD